MSTTRKPRRLFNVEKRGVKQQGIKPAHHLPPSQVLWDVVDNPVTVTVKRRFKQVMTFIDIKMKPQGRSISQLYIQKVQDCFQTRF